MNRPVVGTAIAAVVISLFAGAVMAQTQLDIAGRVLTGTAQCEFDQRVSLQAADGMPGHFKLAFKNVSYNMVPEETTTGAVRLEDKKAGVVWVQIPQKSMLLNSKSPLGKSWTSASVLPVRYSGFESISLSKMRS